MRSIRRSDEGETLLEIVIAIVVIGIVFSGFFAAYSTAAKTSTTHRTAAQADALLRNAAEATKAAVRDQCADDTASKPGATYSATLPSAPSGWSALTVTPPDQTCPPIPTSSTCPPTTSASAASTIPCLKLVKFSITPPNSSPRTLTIEVRTP
jgi:type II secretory pathway pseudopilin PulG